MDSDSDFDPDMDAEMSDDEEWVLESAESDIEDEELPRQDPLTQRDPNTPQAGTMGDSDPGPPSQLPPFQPGRVLGVQFTDDVRTRSDKTGYITPLDFFQMFFTIHLVAQLCKYTNEAAQTLGSLKPATFRGWFDIEPPEFYRLLGLLMYMGIVQAPSVDKAYSKKSLYNGLWYQTSRSATHSFNET